MSTATATGALAVPARPRLRGTLHAVAAPVAAAVGLGVLLLADQTRAQVGVGVWVLAMTALFTVSAVYHRGRWRPGVRAWLQRADHSMIFVFIAGSYTPICLLVLDGAKSWLLLALAWGGAAAGVATRLVWHTAPRWLFGPMYLALGWVAVMVLPDLVRSAPPQANALLVAGGLLYSVGALVFATRWPDPRPSVFGYHEVFHALTVAAAACHAAAIASVVVHA
jgi:hemolysin III